MRCEGQPTIPSSGWGRYLLLEVVQRRHSQTQKTRCKPDDLIGRVYFVKFPDYSQVFRNLHCRRTAAAGDVMSSEKASLEKMAGESCGTRRDEGG